MRAAEKLDVAIEAADEPETLTALVGSLHKVGRALRTSIALEAKLERDAAADARAAAEAGEARAGRAVETRKARVRDAVERRIWTELDPAEAEVWTADFDERLETEALDDAFTDEPLDDQVERLARDLGLTGACDHEYLPRALRPAPRPAYRSRAAWDVDFAALYRRGDDAEDDDPDPDGTAGDPPPANPPPGGHPPGDRPPRLAPPMDLPSWETD
ncbi:hypothetical protein DJ019_03570 [Phenylobacterium kunshanense]|uniref:Uncharacterized protein n=2 Tax=Phenylobacterium kunshanense TaxID=1445034 RepID=A0A328BPW4_9CAUL|nr:hypothetical protein DJ019_03570 [Phenylobacterium kunshanense]